MKKEINKFLEKKLDSLLKTGFFKSERAIYTPQQPNIKLSKEQEVINLCANNYLGFSNEPRLIHTAQKALEQYGFGLSSVRFICGTQVIHQELEKIIANFLQTDDSILFSSCFDANSGIFSALLDSEDAVISDELNHASIIDGIRLSKAQRLLFRHNDMKSLEEKLKDSQNSRFRLIITDGVFSMTGSIANLPEITTLAKKYNALVAIDDSHAIGITGKEGRGTAEYHNLSNGIDIYIGTLGKALGGAAGGYIASSKSIVSYLRQSARPYLFSNSLSPMIVASTIEAFNILSENGNNLRAKLNDNTSMFRNGLKKLGFKIYDSDHPIIPIMLNDAGLAIKMAENLLQMGCYVVSFSYPVVPKGKARIRVQISAAHTKEQLNFALEKFALAGKALGII